MRPTSSSNHPTTPRTRSHSQVSRSTSPATPTTTKNTTNKKHKKTPQPHLVSATFSLDVVRTLFSFLSLRELLAASSVDRLWFCAGETPSLWKHLLTLHFGDSTMELLVGALERKSQRQQQRQQQQQQQGLRLFVSPTAYSSSLPSSSTFLPSVAASSSSSFSLTTTNTTSNPFKSLFRKQYLNNKKNLHEEEDDPETVKAKDEARWQHIVRNLYLQVQVLRDVCPPAQEEDEEEEEEDDKKKKKNKKKVSSKKQSPPPSPPPKVLFSLTIPLSDGDELLRLFNDDGVHLFPQKGGTLDLLDYNDVDKLRTTLTFIDLGVGADDNEQEQDGGGGGVGDGVRMARVLTNTGYWQSEQLDRNQFGWRLLKPSLGVRANEDRFFPYDVMNQSTSLLTYRLLLVMRPEQWNKKKFEFLADQEAEMAVKKRGENVAVHAHAHVQVVRGDDEHNCSCGDCPPPTLEFETKLDLWRHLGACLAEVDVWK